MSESVSARISYEELKENLAFLDDWEERYKYILDLGKKLSPYLDDNKTDEFRIKGCVSQVWLDHAFEGDNVIFVGDSDSHLVRGLLAVLFIIYSGQSLGQIAAINFEQYFKDLGLAEHLTPQRSNGVFSVVAYIKNIHKDNDNRAGKFS